jgi:rRNA maturation endonuclease Nob1
MASCPECGKILPEGYKICPACGGSIAHLKDEITAHINLMRKKAEIGRAHV